jgi:hypothetical protein
MKALYLSLIFLFSSVVLASDGEIDFWVAETDIADDLTELKLTYEDISIDKNELIIGMMFLGDPASNNLQVFFGEQELALLSNLEDIHNSLGLVIADTTGLVGQQADVTIIISNTGSDDSSLYIPYEFRNMAALEQQVSFTTASKKSDDDDSGSSSLFVLAALSLLLVFKRKHAHS